MKRIEFIAPVEAMRGNLGSKQDLRYADHDNKAWDAPDGRQYARNYQPRYIGAKRAADGLKIFQVKTKAATNISTETRKNMAVLGGTGAIVGAAKIGEHEMGGAPFYSLVAVVNYAINDYESPNLERVERAATFFRNIGFDYNENKDNVEKFVYDCVFNMTKRKQEQISWVYISSLITAHLDNPYGSLSQGNVTIGKATLIKFWTQLAPGGATFNVAGDTGICFEGNTFDDVTHSEHVNVLGLSIGTIGQEEYVKLGNEYLKLDDDYVKAGDEVDTEAGVMYILTSVAPEP